MTSRTKRRAHTKIAPEAFEEALSALEKRVGYSFRNKMLLRSAMTHPSYITEKEQIVPCGVLEALGDNELEIRVLKHSVSVKEKELAHERVTGFLNSNLHLARIGYHVLELHRALRVSPSFVANVGPETQIRRMADTVEALIGAIHRDGGEGAVDDFIYSLLIPACHSSPYMKAIYELHDQAVDVKELVHVGARLFSVPMEIQVVGNEVLVECDLRYRARVLLNENTKRTGVLRGVTEFASSHPWSWYGFLRPAPIPMPLVQEPLDQERLEENLRVHYPESTIAHKVTFVTYTETEKFSIEETWERVALPALLPTSTSERGPYIDKLRLRADLAGKDVVIRSEPAKRSGAHFALYVDGRKRCVTEPCRTLNDAANQMIRFLSGSS